VLINVQLEKSLDFNNHHAVKLVIAQAEQDLGADGRVLLRASGTEPVIRVMVEGKHQSRVKMLAEIIAEAVRAAV
jgi:phosphoglucosamine mutase